MGSSGDDGTVGLGYPLEQLARALLRGEPQAKGRVERWRRVIAGMLGGTLDIGSRTPVAATPAWVTLEVAHGGFATGGFAAGGPLLDHETAMLDALGAVIGETQRATLNLRLACRCEVHPTPASVLRETKAWLNILA
jgi:hypothetical protein